MFRFSGINGQRCRVVTLKGEDVQTSGAMTGGGAGTRKYVDDFFNFIGLI